VLTSEFQADRPTKMLVENII